MQPTESNARESKLRLLNNCLTLHKSNITTWSNFPLRNCCKNDRFCNTHSNQPETGLAPPKTVVKLISKFVSQKRRPIVSYVTFPYTSPWKQRHEYMLVGYARVSTLDQNLDLQWDALLSAGCEKVFTDIAGGVAFNVVSVGWLRSGRI